LQTKSNAQDGQPRSAHHRPGAQLSCPVQNQNVWDPDDPVNVVMPGAMPVWGVCLESAGVCSAVRHRSVHGLSRPTHHACTRSKCRFACHQKKPPASQAVRFVRQAAGPSGDAATSTEPPRGNRPPFRPTQWASCSGKSVGRHTCRWASARGVRLHHRFHARPSTQRKETAELSLLPSSQRTMLPRSTGTSAENAMPFLVSLQERMPTWPRASSHAWETPVHVPAQERPPSLLGVSVLLCCSRWGYASPQTARAQAPAATMEPPRHASNPLLMPAVSDVCLGWKPPPVCLGSPLPPNRPRTPTGMLGEVSGVETCSHHAAGQTAHVRINHPLNTGVMPMLKGTPRRRNGQSTAGTHILGPKPTGFTQGVPAGTHPTSACLGT